MRGQFGRAVGRAVMGKSVGMLEGVCAHVDPRRKLYAWHRPSFVIVSTNTHVSHSALAL